MYRLPGGTLGRDGRKRRLSFSCSPFCRGETGTLKPIYQEDTDAPVGLRPLADWNSHSCKYSKHLEDVFMSLTTLSEGGKEPYVRYK